MSSVDSGISTSARRHFLQALRRVLRPIVRLMIRSGVRYDEFADLARRAYVESAIRDTDRHGPRPTRDQIAWVTGISAERVDHYIESDEALPSADQSASSKLSEVLHRWYTDPQYQGPSGAPLEIEITAPAGPSFHKLVAQVDNKAKPEHVLEELLAARAVTYSGDSRVRAVTRCFIWPREEPSFMDYFGTTLAHLIETHEHNFSCANVEDKRLERSVFADRGLPRQQISMFHAVAEERTDQFLSDLDDWLAQHTTADVSQAGERIEIGVNVFFYVEAPSDSTSTSTLVQPRRDLNSADDGRA